MHRLNHRKLSLRQLATVRDSLLHSIQNFTPILKQFILKAFNDCFLPHFHWRPTSQTVRELQDEGKAPAVISQLSPNLHPSPLSPQLWFKRPAEQIWGWLSYDWFVDCSCIGSVIVVWWNFLKGSQMWLFSCTLRVPSGLCDVSHQLSWTENATLFPQLNACVLDWCIRRSFICLSNMIDCGHTEGGQNVYSFNIRFLQQFLCGPLLIGHPWCVRKSFYARKLT